MNEGLRHAQSELGHAIFRLREHELVLAADTALRTADLFAGIDNPNGAGFCYAVAAMAQMQQGGLEQAGHSLGAARSLAQQTGDNDLLGTCLEIDADRLSFGGDGEGARRAVTRAHQLYATKEDRVGMIRTQITLAELTFMVGSHVPAERLLTGLEQAVAELETEPEAELLGRLAGATACSCAAAGNVIAAKQAFDTAVEKLAGTTLPSLIGRIAMNTAQLLAHRGHPEDAGAMLDQGVAHLQAHGNTALEYKLVTARAVFSQQAGRYPDAEAALSRALVLGEHLDEPSGRRQAMLEFGIDVANALMQAGLASRRWLQLSRLHRSQGRFEDGVAALLAAMTDLEEPERGAAAAELEDMVYSVPLNSHPLQWFVDLVGKLVMLRDLDLAAQFLEARAASERGSPLAHLQVSMAEVAILRRDFGEADRLYFEAIHLARLHGVPEREAWIRRHQQLTDGSL